MVLTPWLTTVFTIVYHGPLLPHYTMVILVPKHHGIYTVVNSIVYTMVNYGFYHSLPRCTFTTVYIGNTCSNSPWYQYHDKLWFLYHG